MKAILALGALSNVGSLFAFGRNKATEPESSMLSTLSLEPFLGEIQITSITFAPRNWAFCNGQILAISQNPALFSLLGTTYGGDGRTTFALPDLRGRMPIHTDFNNFYLGTAGGEETHTLNVNEIPAHTHAINASTAPGGSASPVGNFAAVSKQGVRQYAGNSNAVMSPSEVGNAGGNQPHNNLPPYLTLNFIIALQGVFPSRT